MKRRVPASLLAANGPAKKPTQSPTSEVPTYHSGGADMDAKRESWPLSPATAAAIATKTAPTTCPTTKPAKPMRSQAHAALRVAGGGWAPEPGGGYAGGG